MRAAYKATNSEPAWASSRSTTPGLAVQLLKLEPTVKRGEAISEGIVNNVVTEKMETAYFLGLVCAEPRDDQAGSAVAGVLTHL